MAERLAEIAPLSDRVRVIAGAAPTGFRVPDDAAARRTELQLPGEYVVLSGDAGSLPDGFRAMAHTGLQAVVLDAEEGSESTLVDLASAAGMTEDSLHLRGALDDLSRAATLSGAGAIIATSSAMRWPWRLIEAMELGVPVVAVDSGVHRDVIADGGALVARDDLADAVVDALGPGRDRLRVLGSDRARAFSWASAAERVWALHAEL
jgi:glycosyltransferase involved in cell wall biosynthesis